MKLFHGGVEELLSDFSSHSENGATILSFRAAAGAESQFQKEQLQKEERTYSQAVRQIVLCRKHIELAHDCAD
jgi:hypothetical protein